MNNITPEEISTLIDACLKAKDKAYSPYSNFPVGAAIMSNDGKVFTGCNVENSSFGLTICAERTAYLKAVSEGSTSFKAVAVCTNVIGRFVTPCGACRQFMIEFGNVQVILTNNKKEHKLTTLRKLLPESFNIDDLQQGQKNINLH